MFEGALESVRNLVTLAHMKRCSANVFAKETYEENRRGGKWDTLLKRLEFISTLKNRADGTKRQLPIMMVVQDNNFREIPVMIELATGLGFYPVFSKILDCGTYPKGEFEKRAVWMESHPNFEELKKVITESVGKAGLTNLSDIIRETKE